MHRLLSLLVLLSPGAALAQPVDARALDRLLEADADRNGAVTRAELLDYRRRSFTRFDRNGDGALSNADAPGPARRLAGPRIAEMTAQFDSNADGRVGRVEYESGPTPVFDSVDVNRDGRATREEIAAARKAHPS